MKGIANSTVYTLDAGPQVRDFSALALHVMSFFPSALNSFSVEIGLQMLAVQIEMTTRIVNALKGADNVMIELVFMTDGLAVEWASKIAAAARAADPSRLIVLPTQ